MAYGINTLLVDEYLQMSEHTARDALFFFNMCIIELYMPKYLRKPTLEDVVKIQQKHNNVHGFPGMLESIDCMHWEWKNCPVSWQGQYGRGDKKYPTIMLEVVASQDLLIWPMPYKKVHRKDVERAFQVFSKNGGTYSTTARRAYAVNTIRRKSCMLGSGVGFGVIADVAADCPAPAAKTWCCQVMIPDALRIRI
ncbi:probable serine/threonine-protein kinase PBL7 [Tanacetum coccineum]